METKWTIKEYYEQLHTNKLDNLDKMNKFLETHDITKSDSRNRKSEHFHKKWREWISNQISQKRKAQDQIALLANCTSYKP